MYGIIYKLTNKNNGMSYIGQTTGLLESRISQHLREKRNRHITNALKKYGKDVFEIEVLVCCFDKNSLNAAEVYFVQKFNTLFPNGYNHRAGGNQNGVCSEELKKKISLAKKGKPVLCRRGETRPLSQRIQISRSLGGQNIIGKNVKTGELKVYYTAHDTKKDGHNPSNVIQICKGSARRHTSKGFTFFYENVYYANQSGSSEFKSSKHAQRIGLEPANSRIK
jgi:group I intron endonuclease